ncbi:MAG: hypothetical protein A3B38_03495 [Candidatus Levybacteria bacterium RIFCSPLOWO2_01_FULL_36_13]|nr:MAG: hypothetical protein A2684_00430 [Candidatus Levybacteria bacterium RIFCSPHIGHO2_01_FULL_36_15b]OGH34202.1 MAG: hypothetical protein A3B38_03495 [Candidatus Levybacteria bacterium RIFCSPLOWO2_01_FULL_36_13]
MNKIIPGILETKWEDIEKKIETAKILSKTIHIDIIDGVFAKNQTFLDPKPFSKYSNEIFFEAHFMVDNPLKFLEPFADAGFKRFLGHVEKMPDIAEFVAKGQLLGEVGLALDIDTNPADLKINLEDLDCLLLMGVKAGESGQQMQTRVFGKLQALKSKTFIPIEIDGGINDSNIVELQKMGADRFVSTSFLFSGNPLESFKKLVNLVDYSK